jgi:hypothetical protein
MYNGFVQEKEKSLHNVNVWQNMKREKNLEEMVEKDQT